MLNIRKEDESHFEDVHRIDDILRYVLSCFPVKQTIHSQCLSEILSVVAGFITCRLVYNIIKMMTALKHITFFFFFFGSFGAPPLANGGSQGGGPMGAASAGLGRCPINARSEPHPRPRPQLMAMPDP